MDELKKDDFESEKEHLEVTLDKIKDKQQALEQKIDHLQDITDKELAASLAKSYYRQLENIRLHGDSPYFAKLIYKDDNEFNAEELYIGKVGVLDKNGVQLVVDWRAPISTLYYDSEVGRVSYVAPSGNMSGDLRLKRQIVIEDRKLKSVSDSDLMTNDELLKPYLAQGSDKRLKSIVATIQSEQNKIIRASRRNMVVQGVAGSGKTTVALHRLSYLIYQTKKFDSSADFLIIGPNKLFLNYISNVLPELDTGNASQYTFEEIAKEVLGEKIKIIDKRETLKNILNGETKSKYLKIKTSIRYKYLLDKYLEQVDKYLLPKSITYKGVELLSREELYQYYLLMKTGNISADFDRLGYFVVGRLASNPDKSEALIKRVEQRAAEMKVPFLITDKWKLREMFEKGKPEIFKKQISLKKVSIFSIYSTFLEFLLEHENFKDLAEETLKNLHDKKVDFEDLAALIYLKQKISPCKSFDNICHVIVDEAQDFGLFHYVAMKTMFKNCTFDLYGDINQAIYSYSSIDNWEGVINEVFGGDCRYLELVKSYRTTMEIMNAANLIGNNINLIKGQPVLRQGGEVYVEPYSVNDYAKTLTEIVKSESSKYSTVAILCKNQKECSQVFQTLKKNGVESQILNEDSKINGILISTIQDSKGLEFDSVILNDASNKNFDSTSLVDMKLLYVAMTRGMHNMTILSGGDVVEPLKPLKHVGLKKNNLIQNGKER